MKTLSLLLSLVCVSSLWLIDASAGQISYTGSGTSAGLNATADFQLIASKHLKITLHNTSVTRFGGVDGDAAMVLSSLNFDLGAGIEITSGSVALSSGSDVVTREKSKTGGVWGVLSWKDELGKEYGFSNTGIGNSAKSGAILSNITKDKLKALNNSVTSHSNGGNKRVTPFKGAGKMSGGLDFGLVAARSSAFGKKKFIRSWVVIDLMLSQEITDLSFLTTGSYVEFGSDNAFTGGVIIGGSPPPPASAAPEPGAMAIWLLLGVGGVARRRSRSKRA